MARPTDVIDPWLQSTLVEAEQALDREDYLETVRKCVEVYRRIAEQRPEMVLRPPNPLMPLPAARSVREGRRNALQPWPVRLGVGLSFDAQDRPLLTFEKEEFSMSEAASYFEFTLDMALRAQRA
jgi:hypothetical protein